LDWFFVTIARLLWIRRWFLFSFICLLTLVPEHGHLFEYIIASWSTRLLILQFRLLNLLCILISIYLITIWLLNLVILLTQESNQFTIIVTIVQLQPLMRTICIWILCRSHLDLTSISICLVVVIVSVGLHGIWECYSCRVDAYFQHHWI